MKVTRHAAERFLQRVLNKKSYTRLEMYRAYKFLEAETKDIVVHGYKVFFPLPSFNRYSVLVIDNEIVTVMPKVWVKHP